MGFANITTMTFQSSCSQQLPMKAGRFLAFIQCLALLCSACAINSQQQSVHYVTPWAGKISSKKQSDIKPRSIVQIWQRRPANQLIIRAIEVENDRYQIFLFPPSAGNLPIQRITQMRVLDHTGMTRNISVTRLRIQRGSFQDLFLQEGSGHNGASGNLVYLASYPEEEDQIVRQHKRFIFLNEEDLAKALFEKIRNEEYEFVNAVFSRVTINNRDDVAIALMRLLSDDALARIAATVKGRALLVTIFDELTSGEESSDEENASARLLRSYLKAVISIEKFERAALLENIKVFPTEEMALSKYDSAPLMANPLPDRRIHVKYAVRVLGTEKYRQETQSLPAETFINGIDLPEDELIEVVDYDKGKVAYCTIPLSLVEVSNNHSTKIFENIATLAVTVPAFMYVAGEEAGVAAARWLWADRIALGLATTTSVIKEHRGWILENYGGDGRRFLRYVDLAQFAVGIYGATRLVISAPKFLKELKQSYLRWRGLSRLRQEEAQYAKLNQTLEELLEQFDSVPPSIISAVSVSSRNLRNALSPADLAIIQQIEAELASILKQAVANVKSGTPSGAWNSILRTLPNGSRNYRMTIGNAVHEEAFRLIDVAQKSGTLPPNILVNSSRSMPLSGTAFSGKAPDVRLPLANGREAIWDFTTTGQIPEKARKYSKPFVDYFSVITYNW